MAPTTITVELDDEAGSSLDYCAAERAGGDRAEAIRQAIDAYRASIVVANYRAKETRIAAQAPVEIDPDSPETAEETAFLNRVLGTHGEKTSAA